jgi:ribonuclease P/MRP protein subunit POP5
LLTITATVKYFSPATSTAIVRVARDKFRIVWAALTYIREIPDPQQRTGGVEGQRSCVFKVVRVSGTIRKSVEEVVRVSRIEARRGKMSITAGGHGQDEAGVLAILGAERNMENSEDDDDDDDSD